MSEGRSSFGMILLMVVMVIVLMLVAQAWQKFGPAAIAVTDIDSAPVVDDHGQTGAGEEIRSGRLPRLQETKEATDAHAEQVQEALNGIE